MPSLLSFSEVVVFVLLAQLHPAAPTYPPGPCLLLLPLSRPWAAQRTSRPKVGSGREGFLGHVLGGAGLGVVG